MSKYKWAAILVEERLGIYIPWYSVFRPIHRPYLFETRWY